MGNRQSFTENGRSTKGENVNNYQPQQPPPRSRAPLIFMLACVGVLAIVGAVGLGMHFAGPPTAAAVRADDPPSETKATPTSTSTDSPAPAPAPSPPMTPIDRLWANDTVEKAIAFCGFSDSRNDTDPGAAKFAIWSMKRLAWDDIAGSPTTHVSRVLKDPDAERGKHDCWGGSIVEIHAQKTDFGTAFDGGLILDNAQVIKFIAVRDTGDLVVNSPARICGIVVGLADYDNSGGGVTHAVQIVGMFDLPGNRAAPPPMKKTGGSGTTIDLGR